MKRVIAIMLILIMAFSLLSVGAAAAGDSVPASEPADTGDMFGVIIVMLLVSAIGVAALVACRTRFVTE